MAKRENFNDLISSIQEAFLQANQMSEYQHLNMLQNYFDEDNNPICIEINTPYFLDDGAIEYKQISVPKLCLVPISSLKLNEIDVDFKVKLYGKIKLKQSEEAATGGSGSRFMSLENSGTQNVMGCIVDERKTKTNSDSYANISLRFVAEDVPEGLMKISDGLNKIL